MGIFPYRTQTLIDERKNKINIHYVIAVSINRESKQTKYQLMYPIT